MGNDPNPSSTQAIFHDAAALSAADQPAFLDAACNGNPERRLRLERMLAADSSPHTDWQVPALEAFVRHGGVSLPDYTARSFGPYRVVERIGSGGMAVVYKAVREDAEYRQRVAIKVLPYMVSTHPARSNVFDPSGKFWPDRKSVV